MNLSSHFDKAARRVKMLTNSVVAHRFDHCEGHLFLAEIIEGVFDQFSSDTAPLDSAVNSRLGILPFETARSIRVVIYPTT